MACHSGHGDFFGEICRRFAAAGRVQLWALEAAGRPVAYQCNLLGASSVFQFKVAFDESMGQYSPGLQLDLDLVDEFHSDARFDMVDSCTGAASTFSHQLYPDRRELADLVLPLNGLVGQGVARAAPQARAAYRRAKKLRRFVAEGT
jgi:CelD/BcsL family acetyltransferase involved in cellulose biosynthesis